jgi:hypothetical protein
MYTHWLSYRSCLIVASTWKGQTRRSRYGNVSRRGRGGRGLGEVILDTILDEESSLSVFMCNLNLNDVALVRLGSREVGWRDIILCETPW